MHRPDILILGNKQSEKFFKELVVMSWAQPADHKKGKTTNIAQVFPDCISTLESFQSFLKEDEKNWPEYVFVTPELGWSDDIPLFEQGYRYARDLITACPSEHCLQIVFLSILEPGDLTWFTGYHCYPMIQAFRHYGLKDLFPNPSFFEKYSLLHFKMIRAVVISDHGRADKVNHDLASIKTKYSGGQSVLKDAVLLLNDIRSFEQLLDRTTDLKLPKDDSEVESFLASAELLMSEIYREVPKTKDEERLNRRKPDYHVLVIEDDAFMRNFIATVFAERFEHIDFMDFTGADKKGPMTAEKAAAFIREKGKKYQVFIIDLLYCNKDGRLLNFNGLDLYDQILDLYPFAAVRIITSLPRPAVSRLSERAMINKIPLSYLLSKTDDFKKLLSSLEQSLEEVIKQCDDNERFITAYQSIPKSGFFGKQGIGGQLYDLILNDRPMFEGLVEKGRILYETALDDPEYQIVLSKAGAEMSFQEFITKLPAIMAYRRLIIAAGEYERKGFWIRKDPEKLPVGSRRMGNRQLIYTQLGFNATFKEYQEELAFRIFTKNFFAYERAFLADCEAAYEANVKDDLLTGPVQAWFHAVLSDKVIVEGLPFLVLEPPVNARVSDDGRLTYQHGELNNFLRALLNRFDIPEVQILAEQLVLNHFLNDKPEVTKAMAPNSLALFEKIEDAYYESGDDD